MKNCQTQREILEQRTSIAARAAQAKMKSEYIRNAMSNTDGTCKKHTAQQYGDCSCNKRINAYTPL